MLSTTDNLRIVDITALDTPLEVQRDLPITEGIAADGRAGAPGGA